MRKRGLVAYQGKDLSQLDAGALQTFQKQLEALTGDKPELKRKRAGPGFEPWWVKRFSAGTATWMLLEAYPSYAVPDVSAVRVHIFDKDWNRLIKQSFPTGYRFFLDEAQVIRNKLLGQDVLVTKTTCSGPFRISEGEERRPTFEQGTYQRQYYALLRDQLVLVRLEDNAGALARNDYHASEPWKGPPVPVRTQQEWIQSLSSIDPVEQLATLVWLSGVHLSSTERRYKNVNQESRECSKVFEAVRDSPQAWKALQQLTASKHPWLQGYARLAQSALWPQSRTDWLRLRRSGIFLKQHRDLTDRDPPSFWQTDVWSNKTFRKVATVGILLPFMGLLLFSCWILFGALPTILYLVVMFIGFRLYDVYEERRQRK